MEGDRGKYTKDPVKVRFTTKADGRKSISFEIYQNGKRTYERHQKKPCNLKQG